MVYLQRTVTNALQLVFVHACSLRFIFAFNVCASLVTVAQKKIMSYTSSHCFNVTKRTPGYNVRSAKASAHGLNPERQRDRETNGRVQTDN